MSCSSIKLKGISRECDGNIGGIKKAWMISAGGVEVADAAIAAAESNAHQLPASALTLSDTGVTFMSYTFAKNTGSLTSTLTNDANGKRYSNALALQFNRMEGKKHLEIEAIAAGDAQILVMDNNNKVWFIGADNAATLDEATVGTGEGYEGLNGYNTTITAVSAHLPFEVLYTGENKTAWEALIADPAED